MTRRWISALLLGLSAATLAGCSTPRVMEGAVQSYSQLAALPTPPTYRLERLPSQQQPAFDAIAGLAMQALARVGLQADPVAPRLLVQINTQAGTTPRYDPYGAYGAPWGWGLGGGYGRGSWGLSGRWRMGPPSPLYHRAVQWVMRDAATQAIVYESSAVHDDVWVADPAVYGLLFDAALTGFPQAPAGPRQVRIPFTPPP
ncbi:MAG: DUF4136 domain-containing protein [Burkholderiaceae bacterium]|nr:DUF4136 domain-containing protein [Burkholderiaceae bacterium]